LKKILIILVVIGLVATSVAIISRHYPGRTDTNEPSTPPRTSGQTANPPERPAAKPPAKPGKSTTGSFDQALKAAVTATRDLSQSQFLPADARNRVIADIVTPSKVASFQTAYASSGPLLARAWGYSDTAQTLAQANYYVSTLKYRTEHYGKRSATFWLYTISHWVTAGGQEYLVPNITVVQLKWNGLSWRFVDSHDPPPNKMPVPELNLSYQQTVQRFQPFLKGFQSYEENQ